MAKPTKPTNRLHPRNAHQGRYDFEDLQKAHPELAEYVKPNVHGTQSIDFADPAAVLALNTALLKAQYQVEWWSIPAGFLCPPIPGRADYIHHAADLLAASNQGTVPQGAEIRCLDIGVGANLIYPIIGRQAYGWSFIGSEIDVDALEAARLIQEKNSFLENGLELRLQKKSRRFFNGALEAGERIDLTLCNPPFHASKEDAEAATLRKLQNLKGQSGKVLNFGGKDHELWYPGGELKFIRNMIQESLNYSKRVFWFTSLVSKEKHLKALRSELKKVNVQASRTIPMGQGNKSSRLLAWTFLSAKQQKAWQESRWKQ